MIIIHGKHEDEIFETALEAVIERISGWYDNWDDGDPNHQWEDRARLVIEKQDENLARGLLQARSDEGCEYEDVDFHDEYQKKP